ncbi:MAG: DUF1641 domain-containing protein [Alphaproteobacteria bacterium]|nr:DUF1641 domain-containing protein [Alphaproteobacteria bacterium]
MTEQAKVKAMPNMPEDETARLILALREALTDSMVERLAVTGSNALEVVDRLNDETTRDAIHTVLDRLTELHQIGALDTLFDLVAVIHASKSASTDAIVERLFAFVEQMMNTFGSDNLSRLADGAAEAMEDAVHETRDVNPSGGILSTVSMLSKPETQKSLMFLLKFAENLQKRCCD